MARRQTPEDDYAKNQRRIRSLQPKVSSEKAHARARRALAVNSEAERQAAAGGDQATGSLAGAVGQAEPVVPAQRGPSSPLSSPGRGGKSSRGRGGTAA